MTRSLILLSMILLAAWAAGCSAGDDDDGASSAADDDTADIDDDTADDDSTADDDTGPTIDELIQRFRPVVIQKLADDYAPLPYPETSDQLGVLSAHPGDGDFEYAVQVDTGAPVVYTDWRMVKIHNRDRLQLLYAFFYPERPIPITPEDGLIEYLKMYIWSGLIDGKVVRLTLDADHETPLFIEVARNCGCDWQFYVNQLVDDAARAEFEAAGETYPGLVKPDAPADVQYVHIMPPDAADAATDRVAIVAADGWTDIYPHLLLGAFTSYEQWQASDLEIAKGDLYLDENEDFDKFNAGSLNKKSYATMNYDILYTLPLAGTEEPVGIFDAFHYVWNSYSPLTNWMRRQCCFVGYPGTPKDPDYLEVVHETIDFWDPTIYDTFIYMPESLFGPA